jgi:hypothetical protein
MSYDHWKTTEPEDDRDPLYQDWIDAQEDPQDPVEGFQLELDIAKFQAKEGRFPDAYRTLVRAYDNLILQHEEAIEEVLELRKRLHLQ